VSAAAVSGAGADTGSDAGAGAGAAVPRGRRRPNALRRLAQRAGGGEALTGIVIMLALVAIAILAPYIAPHDPEAIDSSRVLAPPDLAHPFGSDSLGRDVFSRVLYAFRVSLSVAIGSVALAFLIAVPLGLL
jgi:peptide/nickel transport system permease protein